MKQAISVRFYLSAQAAFLWGITLSRLGAMPNL